MLVQKLGGLYVVRRPFKSKGILYPAGKVLVNVAEIRYWKSRVANRDILSLFPNNDKENLPWIDYLENRTGKLLDSRIYELIQDKSKVKGKIVLENKETVQTAVPQAPKTSTPKVDAVKTQPSVQTIKPNITK